MKGRFAIVALLAVAIIAVLIAHRRSKSVPAQPVNPASEPAVVPAGGNTNEETMTAKPTAESQRSAVGEPAARQNGAKQMNGPVVFHAKVVDQYSQPVPGVSLVGTLNVFDEALVADDRQRVLNVKIQLVSDAAGCFDLKRERGSMLRVESLEKEGFLWQTPSDLGTFEFSLMRHPKQPPAYKDENRRFIFHVWKKGTTSPLLQHSLRIRLSPEQESYGINLVTGQRVESNDSADLIIWIPLVKDSTGAARGDRWFIFEVPRGGILETPDEYPYAAPSDGYQPQWKWLHEIGKAGSDSWRKNFYVNSRGGRIYAGVSMSWGIGATAFEISAVVNPTGATQLEPDASKRITEPEEIRQFDESLRSK